MKINEAIIKYHEKNRYTDIFQAEGLLGKKEHIKNVITLSRTLADYLHSDLDRNFLDICSEHHDDGRVNQYELLGKFWDTKISHNSLGIDRFNKFLIDEGDFTVDTSLEIFRDVILYHGRMKLANLSPESKKYVEIVTAADDFENVCSCISYLLKEVETDAKGYISNNPQADQTFVSDFVFEHFKNGEKFDKIKYCNTYAEYILFVATLAIDCIKKYGNLAKLALSQPGYGYSSIILGFKDIFEKTLSSDMAKDSYKFLSSSINNNLR